MTGVRQNLLHLIGAVTVMGVMDSWSRLWLHDILSSLIDCHGNSPLVCSVACFTNTTIGFICLGTLAFDDLWSILSCAGVHRSTGQQYVNIRMSSEFCLWQGGGRFKPDVICIFFRIQEFCSTLSIAKEFKCDTFPRCEVNLIFNRSLKVCQIYLL